MSSSIPFPSVPSQEIRLKVGQLTPVLEQMLVKKSMFQFDATVAVKRMLEADLYGIPSHGAGRICEYLDAMDLGDIDPRARVLILHETDSITVLDGSRSIGHVAATKGMESAVGKAKSSGVGIAAVGNSQTLGAASVYARLAAEQNVIAIAMTSTGGATVAAPGTKIGAVGNTALAYSVPLIDRPPLVFDAACGAESWGKLNLLQRYGIPIPGEIVFDDSGKPADSTAEAKVMEPAGGQLGFGLSMLCSVLAGPLCGGWMPIKKKRSESAEDSQHFFMAFHVEAFADPERFSRQLVAALDEIRELETGEEGVNVRLPGDRSQEQFQNYSQNGIPFHESIVNEIRNRAEQLGIAVDW